MAKVVINLYDLSNGLARSMSPMLIGKVIEGIWHTGVVVFGFEYYYSGGICKDYAGTTMAGKPYQVIQHGVTQKTQAEFEYFLQTISSKYGMANYHLLNNNCNHFSDECCKFLTGNPLPSHITGLPQEFINTPFGQAMLPFINQMFGGGQSGANAPVQGTSLFGNNAAASPYSSSFPSAPSYPSSYPSSTATPFALPASASASTSAPAPPSPFPILASSKVFLYETASFDRLTAKLIENADAFAKSHPSLAPSDLLAQGILTVNDRAFLQSPQLRDFLTSLLTKPNTRAPPAATPYVPHPLPLPPLLLPLLRRIFSTWGRDQDTPAAAVSGPQLLLPAIDLLRIVCLHSDGASCVCSTKTAGAGAGAGTDNPLYIFNVFRTGFYTAPTTTTTTTPTNVGNSTNASALPPASDALRLMSTRMAVNLFATPGGAAFVTSTQQRLPPAFARTYAGNICNGAAAAAAAAAGIEAGKDGVSTNAAFFVSIACDLILGDNVAFLKQVAACLIHNVAVSLKASEATGASSEGNQNTHDLLNDVCVKILANGITKENSRRKEVEAVVAKAGSAKDAKDVKELKEREDTLTVFLKALGVILLDNDVAAVTFASIGQGEEGGGDGANTTPYDVVKSIKEENAREDVKAVKDVAGEIVGMLDQLM